MGVWARSTLAAIALATLPCTAMAAPSGWSALTRDVGTPAIRIPASGRPRRLGLEGVHVPHATALAATALSHARGLLARHLPLLAPGVRISDLVPIRNDLEHGMRSVVLAQQIGGWPLVGAGVGLRYKNDRLVAINSELHGDVTLPAGAALPMADASEAALAWIGEAASQPVLRGAEGPLVLPMRSARGWRYPLAYRVRVATASHELWEVHIDALSLERLQRRQRAVFGDGALRFDAPVRHPDSPRADYPAPRVGLLIDGQYGTADAAGLIAWSSSASAQLLVSSQGPDVQVTNAAGANASWSVTLASGGTALWSAPSDSEVDAQLSGFVHASLGLAHARELGDVLDDLQIPIEVNAQGSCNAIYDGDQLTFFLASGLCHNSARLADIVYHEIGHMLHDYAFVFGRGIFDRALSEGYADYFAASITGDSGVGRGMYKSDDPLREIDPPNVEYRWPDDVKVDDHLTGLIVSGALWDMRKALVASLSSPAGEALADRLSYQALRWASDIPDMYFELLVADDDDGNLANGTPHACIIDAAFDAHGLRGLRADASRQGVVPAGLADYPIEVDIVGLHSQCDADAVSSAQLVWHLRDDPRGHGVAMEVTESGVRANLSAAVPDGSVVRYQVVVTFADGSVRRFPANPADPYYEMFVGQVEPLYCTGFETDPGHDGWSHGLLAGSEELGADDWMWGDPIGFPGSGDPRAAFSGSGALGNDLGGGSWNGEYQIDKVNYADSPELKVEPGTDLRLQYRRWLNVEDGYFDEASIRIDDETLWRNSPGENSKSSVLHHRDAEWRFHDVPFNTGDRSELRLRFQLASDGSFQLGGWTLDELCVVRWRPTPRCGDATAEGEALCPDDDGGEPVASQPLQPSGGCGCHQPRRSLPNPWPLLLLLGLLGLRRRRR